MLFIWTVESQWLLVLNMNMLSQWILIVEYQNELDYESCLVFWYMLIFSAHERPRPGPQFSTCNWEQGAKRCLETTCQGCGGEQCQLCRADAGTECPVFHWDPVSRNGGLITRKTRGKWWFNWDFMGYTNGGLMGKPLKNPWENHRKLVV